MKIINQDHAIKCVSNFLLAINMKLHVIEGVTSATMMLHQNKLHIVYDVHLLANAEVYPHNQFQGFISFPDAPEGYRRGCNYSLHGSLMVLHTMRPKYC